MKLLFKQCDVLNHAVVSIPQSKKKKKSPLSKLGVKVRANFPSCASLSLGDVIVSPLD